MGVVVGPSHSGAVHRHRFYRNARPNRYPIPKNTRITTATISATSPIMVRKLGCSSFIAIHRIDAWPLTAGRTRSAIR